jgi:hypothetical protein
MTPRAGRAQDSRAAGKKQRENTLFRYLIESPFHHLFDERQQRCGIDHQPRLYQD